jgi:hypothetical protein
MENFVNDVASNNTNTDPETTRQFRTIISKYKQIAGGNIKDSRMKALFDQVNSFDTFSSKSELVGEEEKELETKTQEQIDEELLAEFTAE